MLNKFENFIGFGRAGCNIVESIKTSCTDRRNYFLIDSTLRENADNQSSLQLPVYADPVQQERHMPVARVKGLFKRLSGETLFVLAGTGDIVPGSLRALEIVAKKTGSNKLSILYVRPEEMQSAGQDKRRLDRMIFSVLQEYARSGECARMYVVDNSMMEQALSGTLVLTSYHEQVNNLLSFVLMTLESLNSTKSIYGAPGVPNQTERICTLGVFDVDDGEERWFYNLENAVDYCNRQTCYFFVLTKKSLENAAKLTQIRNMLAQKASLRNRVSYVIHDAQSLPNDYGFCVAVFDEPLKYDRQT